MADANPPIGSLSHLNLPQELLIFLNQLWERQGGGDDLIDTSNALASTLSGRLNARIFAQQAQIDELLGEINTVRSLNNSRLAEFNLELERINKINVRLNGRISELEEQVERHQTKSSLLGGALNELREKINDIEGLI